MFRVRAFWRFVIVVMDIDPIVSFKWDVKQRMHVRICMHKIFEMAILTILNVDLNHSTTILYVANVALKITVPNRLHGGSQHQEKNGLMNEPRDTHMSHII